MGAVLPQGALNGVQKIQRALTVQACSDRSAHQRRTSRGPRRSLGTDFRGESCKSRAGRALDGLITDRDLKAVSPGAGVKNT